MGSFKVVSNCLTCLTCVHSLLSAQIFSGLCSCPSSDMSFVFFKSHVETDACVNCRATNTHAKSATLTSSQVPTPEKSELVGSMQWQKCLPFWSTVFIWFLSISGPPNTFPPDNGSLSRHSALCGCDSSQKVFCKPPEVTTPPALCHPATSYSLPLCLLLSDILWMFICLLSNSYPLEYKHHVESVLYFTIFLAASLVGGAFGEPTPKNNAEDLVYIQQIFVE